MDAFSQSTQRELKRLMSDFHNLTGIKICIFDTEGNEICYYPNRFTPFCAYIRSFPELDVRCRGSDKKALSDCKRTQKAIIYTCHAGLTEGITPIMVNGAIRGFIVIGQARDCQSSKLSLRYGGLDEDKLQSFYDCLQVIPKDKVQSALHILEACVSNEELKKFVQEMNETLGIRILRYIDTNLKENLSVDALCEVFKLSRRELYQIIMREFNCTPAELVKLRRLEYANHLIKNTDFHIVKIAEECGIGDYNYFSKLFRKKFGMSAREVRKV